MRNVFLVTGPTGELWYFISLLSVSCQVIVLNFGTCTVVDLNGTLFEAKMFIHPRIYAFYLQQVSHLTTDGANARFSTS